MWTKVASLSARATLGALAVVQFSAEVRGQDSTSSLRDVAPDRRLAGSLVSRREATLGRQFDPAYRFRLVEALSSLSSKELEALESQGEHAIIPNLLGDSSADLVYTPVVPCRLFDTRLVGGPIAVGTARNFLVATGTGSLAGQGGSASGCGVPMGPATSVIINLAAWAPEGPGNLRAWAVANPQPAQPFATSLNYGAVEGLPAISNGIAVAICDPVTEDCSAGDLRLQANLSGTEVVGDVMGYFSRFTKPVETTVIFDGPFLPASGPGSTILATIDLVPPTTGTAVLSGRGQCGMHPGTSGDNVVVLSAGVSHDDAIGEPLPVKGVVSVPSALPPSGYSEAWSLRREMAVTVGVTTTVMLFAEHVSGGSAHAFCYGTFSVRTTF